MRFLFWTFLDSLKKCFLDTLKNPEMKMFRIAALKNGKEKQCWNIEIFKKICLNGTVATICSIQTYFP
jgi:hypothetical protein